MEIPRDLPDCWTEEQRAENRKLADEYAAPGTVEHFALRLGFMPHDEDEAEAILGRIVREHWWLEEQLDRGG